MSQFKISRRATLAGLAALPVASHIGWAQSGPTRGGTLNFILSTEPVQLTTLTQVSSSMMVSAKVCEGLLEYDHQLQPRAQLATAWDVSEDGLTYSFKLRENVRWHDGKPFTSADVAHSIELLKAVHPRGRQTFQHITKIDTPDDLTVILRLGTPVPFLIRAFAAAESPILPKHLYEGVDPATNPANNAPVGTGPFRFVEWVRGSHIVYERNEDYWDAPKPYVDRVIVRIVLDASARTIAFETGTADLGSRTPVALSDVERLRQNPKLGFETRGYEYSSNILTMQMNLDHEILSRLEVRQAMAHAIDRDAMARTVYYNNSIPCPSPIVPTSPYHDPSPTPYPFDPAKAEAILDAAGLPRGANGERFRISLDVMSYQSEPRRSGEFLRSSLGRIGIGVDVRIEDVASYIRRVYTDREFDLLTCEFSGLFDPIVGVRRLYWSKNIVPGLPFSNASHYRNDRVDELLEQAAIEMNDDKRKEMFREFQLIVMEEVPDINLVMPAWMHVHNARLKDFAVTADGTDGSFASAYLEA